MREADIQFKLAKSVLPTKLHTSFSSGVVAETLPNFLLHPALKDRMLVDNSYLSVV